MRQIENSAWINPDGSAEQAYFREIAQNNWDWLRSKQAEWTALQGEVHGWISLATAPGAAGEASPWQQDYFAGIAAIAAKRGDADAMTYLNWADNWLVGRFLNEAKGFEARDGAGFTVAVRNPVTKEYYDTWAEMGAANRANGWSNETRWLSDAEYARLGAGRAAQVRLVRDQALLPKGTQRGGVGAGCRLGPDPARGSRAGGGVGATSLVRPDDALAGWQGPEGVHLSSAGVQERDQAQDARRAHGRAGRADLHADHS